MEKFFSVDVMKLEVGDIIFTAENAAASKAIRFFTKGKVSHVGLWTGKTMLEAASKGIFSKNPQRILADNKNKIHVLRPKKKLTNIQEQSLINFANKKILTPYSVPEAIFMAPLRWCGIKASDKQFCSRFVAQCFQEIAYELNGIKYPSFCSPQTLFSCDSFFEVKEAIKELNETEIQFTKSLDPLTLHQKNHIEIIKKIQDLLKRKKVNFKINNFQDISDFLIKNRSFDNEFTNIIRSNSYLSDFCLDRYRNPQRYFGDFCTMYIKNNSHEDTVTGLTRNLHAIKSAISDRIKELNTYRDYFISTGLTYYEDHYILHKNIVLEYIYMSKYTRDALKAILLITQQEKNINEEEIITSLCSEAEELFSFCREGFSENNIPF